MTTGWDLWQQYLSENVHASRAWNFTRTNPPTLYELEPVSIVLRRPQGVCPVAGCNHDEEIRA